MKGNMWKLKLATWDQVAESTRGSWDDSEDGWAAVFGGNVWRDDEDGERVVELAIGLFRLVFSEKTMMLVVVLSELKNNGNGAV